MNSKLELPTHAISVKNSSPSFVVWVFKLFELVSKILPEVWLLRILILAVPFPLNFLTPKLYIMKLLAIACVDAIKNVFVPYWGTVITQLDMVVLSINLKSYIGKVKNEK